MTMIKLSKAESFKGSETVAGLSLGSIGDGEVFRARTGQDLQGGGRTIKVLGFT